VRPINVGLLLLVVALALWSYGEHEQAAQSSSLQVSNLSPHQVHTLTLSGRDDPISLELQHGAWQMQRPIQLPANQYQIERILELLSAEVSNHFRVKLGESKAYGLDSESRELRFNQQRFVLGGVTPLGANAIYGVDMIR